MTDTDALLAELRRRIDAATSLEGRAGHGHALAYLGEFVRDKGILDLVEKGARVEEEIAAMRDRAKVAAYQYADRWKRSWQHVGTEIGSPDNMMAKHKAEAGYTIAQLIEALPLTAPTPDTGKETKP